MIPPPERRWVAPYHLVGPLLDRIPPLFFESRTLAALRDALLPKLISGELRVPDAEAFLKARDP